jgi:POT family proton-dependent oligopeptide transporter
MLPLFWSLYDQQGSIWTLQATRMKLFGLSAEQLCTINPLEIMIFVPLFSRVIYPALQSRGISIAPLRRMRWGFFLTAVSFSISGLLESKIENSEEGTINVFWQLPQLTILAVAEIFVSVTGLEFAYTKSPDRLKAFIMAIFFLTTAAGNLISGVLYSSVFTYLTRAMIMHVCALLMMANLGLFYYVSKWWQHREAQQLLPRGMGLSLISPHEGIELAAATRVV